MFSECRNTKVFRQADFIGFTQINLEKIYLCFALVIMVIVKFSLRICYQIKHLVSE